MGSDPSRVEIGDPEFDCEFIVKGNDELAAALG